jgi:hypothetical protein
LLSWVIRSWPWLFGGKDYGEHCGEETDGMPDCQLLLWDRHQAFRPRVLFLENVPAETLCELFHNH